MIKQLFLFRMKTKYLKNVIGFLNWKIKNLVKINEEKNILRFDKKKRIKKEKFLSNYKFL